MTRTLTPLPQFGLFAAMLAFAGLPIYIHAPKFYVDEYGVSLTAIGLALLFLRGLDFAQDPILGWLADRFSGQTRAMAAAGGVILAAAMVGLFAITPITDALVWFTICLALLFTGYSLLTILFYSQGVKTAGQLSENGHVKLATWRETGALIGVCLASIAPLVFMSLGASAPMAVFAIVFAVIALIAIAALAPHWSKSVTQAGSFLPLLKDSVLQRLLIVGLFNAAPVAVTSSLFLFFVEYRIGSPDAAGPLLLLFFLSAAASVPLWGKFANKIGQKRVLLSGMALSILAFAGAALLGTGDALFFALVCIASGAALGADMTLLPALFARRVEATKLGAGQAFGLWAFCTKITLAIAAATVLPVLDRAGFVSGGINPPHVLMVLTLLYAVLPCVLKLVAIIVLSTTKLEEI